MKKYQVAGIAVIVLILLTAVSVARLLPQPHKSQRIIQAEITETLKDLAFYGRLKRVLAAGVPAVICLTLLICASGVTLAHIKRASVHLYEIGEHNKIVVHERDLSIAAPIAMGLMNAEQLKQMNGGLEKAFELYNTMATIQHKQMQGIARAEIPASLTQAHTVPTFAELLNAGSLAPGKPMILGYEHGDPRVGSFLDIYSAAVAGESGSGKTSTMLFLIGSGLISQRIRFFGIDPHYPHPKSLGAKTEPLWKAGLMRMATDKAQMFETLKEIEATIDNRLKQVDIDETPVILVIDELAFLAKQSIGPTLARTMERISTEGRKCAVYMLASSQTWLASRTGAGSSVVRDTLTSAYVHRIKPKQANLLLQDKDEAEKVKRYVKQAGEVLLCPVNDDSVVCQMPYTTEQDMKLVSNMVEPIFVNNLVVDLAVDQSLTSQKQGVDLVDRVNQTLKNPGDLTRLAESAGIDKGYLSKILKRKKPLSENTRTKLLKQLETNVIQFPTKGE